MIARIGGDKKQVYKEREGVREIEGERERGEKGRKREVYVITQRDWRKDKLR